MNTLCQPILCSCVKVPGPLVCCSDLVDCNQLMPVKSPAETDAEPHESVIDYCSYQPRPVDINAEGM